MKIAVLTGGGVAPGMNAAVRAVAQKAFSFGWEVLGVEDSYDGLLEGRLSPIDRNRLGGLVHRGGTFLGTGRSKEVREPEGQERAVERLSAAGAEGRVIIGGGSSGPPSRARCRITSSHTTSSQAPRRSGRPGSGLSVFRRP